MRVWQGERAMIGPVRALTIVAGLVLVACGANLAFAQKSGGILKISFFDNPASMSLHKQPVPHCGR